MHTVERLGRTARALLHRPNRLERARQTIRHHLSDPEVDIDVEALALMDGALEAFATSYPSLKLDDPEKLQEARAVLRELIEHQILPLEVANKADSELAIQEKLALERAERKPGLLNSVGIFSSRSKNKPNSTTLVIEPTVNIEKFGPSKEIARILAKRDVSLVLEELERETKLPDIRRVHPVEAAIEIIAFVDSLPLSLRQYLKMTSKEILLSPSWLTRLVFNKGVKVTIQGWGIEGLGVYADFYSKVLMKPREINYAWTNGYGQPTILSIARLSKKVVLEKILKAL